MAKINTYGVETPALDDELLGTDISDTGTDANGGVANFTLQSVMDLFEANGAAPASFISSGTFADARIAETNVTQHEAALTVTESQISDLGTYAALGANVFTGTQDFNGQQVEASVNKVVTPGAGALTLTTTEHSGNVVVTNGNITVPTTAGFNCVLIAGGAHTVTFNATTSAAMAAGDLMSLVVEDATTIHAVLTASANKVTFT